MRMTAARRFRVESQRPLAGFTLIELLITIALISAIAIAAFASIDGVLRSRDTADSALEQLRQERELRYRLRAYLEQAYTGRIGQPAAGNGRNRTPVVDHTFRGESAKGRKGPADVLRFSTLAVAAGDPARPGTVARVAIETNVPGRNDGPTTLDIRIGDAVELADTVSGDPETGASFQVPVEWADFQYYDGENWVEKWDSDARGRLPWGVTVAVKLREGGNRREPDFRATVLIPGGSGTLEHIATVNDFQSEREPEQDE